MSEILKINTDGGSRGNPGPSAAAWVAYENNKEIYSNAEYLGIGTNNQAEYKAVLLALKWVSGYRKFAKINFILDSELVVRQLIGIYKIKDPELALLASKIKKIIQDIPATITFTSVKRELNKAADKLVNQKLDSVSSLGNLST